MANEFRYLRTVRVTADVYGCFAKALPCTRVITTTPVRRQYQYIALLLGRYLCCC